MLPLSASINIMEMPAFDILRSYLDIAQYHLSPVKKEAITSTERSKVDKTDQREPSMKPELPSYGN